MRWRVKLNDMTGDVLAETLAAAGFDLDGDMLSGFDALDEWGAVADAARDLSQKVREIARLTPGLEIGFTPGEVYEYDADGAQIGKHRKVYAKTARLTLTGFAPTVINTSFTDEELAEIKRQARAEKATQLIRAVMNRELFLEVLRLFDGEPWGTELGHVHDLIQDDVKGDLTRYASKAQLTRFNHSINHQDALGLKARHATLKTEPPPDPMSLKEATAFIRDVAEKWIKEKAAGNITTAAGGGS